MISESTSEFYQSVEKHLEKRLPQYLNYLQAMVEINSYTSFAEGVNRTGLLTSEIFANLGFESSRISSTNPIHGDHLVLTRTGSPHFPPRAIVMISHLDTVYPKEEELQNDFHWRR